MSPAASDAPALSDCTALDCRQRDGVAPVERHDGHGGTA
jgi:hypothetical protein